MSSAGFAHYDIHNNALCNLVPSDGMQDGLFRKLRAQIAVLNLRTLGHNSVHYHQLSYSALHL